MITFYLLPARPVLEEALGRFLANWLPGLRGPAVPAAELAELLQSHLDGRGDAFVIFREDLPEGADALEVLRDGYGAEPGDEVVELRLGAAGAVQARSWRLGMVSAA